LGAAELTVEDRLLDIGIRIHVRSWSAAQESANRRAYLLVHGLASNAQTWDEVAAVLSEAGNPVVAIDQRGHGLSDKPDSGYDFATITQDIHRVLKHLGWERPVLVGQSWGGNVLLEFGARFPGEAQSLVFVDGGFLNLQQRGAWEQISVELRPPDLNGTHRSQIAARIRKMHPNWSEIGIEATLANFETLPDGTIRPWLTLGRHMQILKAMYEQDPRLLYPRIREPVLICAVDDEDEKSVRKRMQVQAAIEGLKQVEVVWFQQAAHDIHVDQPTALASAILDFAGR
jgi:pimeloyl-ACP methyl ester carboxylesterase